MIAILNCSEIDMKISDANMETTDSDDCREMSIVCWPQYKREQDFPVKIDRSLSTYLPSQLVDYVGQASYIQEPKSRKN